MHRRIQGAVTALDVVLGRSSRINFDLPPDQETYGYVRRHPYMDYARSRPARHCRRIKFLLSDD